MWLFSGPGSEVNPLFCCQWKREQEFDLQLLERAAQGDRKDKEDGWLKVQATPVMELDLEPQDYDLDISREVRTGASFMLPGSHGLQASLCSPPKQGSASPWPKKVGA